MDFAIEICSVPSHVSNIESDRRVPSIETGQRIADVFGWSLDRLYRGKT